MIKKIFAPGNDSTLTSFGLFVLRLWFGLTLLLHHGLEKLASFGKTAPTFFDPFHIGSTPSFALAVFAEVVCATLVAVGLLTRFAALSLVINFSVAFFLFHKQAMSGPKSGELAFMYLACFVTLLIAGGGKFSVDNCLFRKSSSKSPSSQPKKK
jgi:putative oxidoreductase